MPTEHHFNNSQEGYIIASPRNGILHYVTAHPERFSQDPCHAKIFVGRPSLKDKPLGAYTLQVVHEVRSTLTIIDRGDD